MHALTRVRYIRALPVQGLRNLPPTDNWPTMPRGLAVPGCAKRIHLAVIAGRHLEYFMESNLMPSKQLSHPSEVCLRIERNLTLCGEYRMMSVNQIPAIKQLIGQDGQSLPYFDLFPVPILVPGGDSVYSVVPPPKTWARALEGVNVTTIRCFVVTRPLSQEETQLALDYMSLIYPARCVIPPDDALEAYLMQPNVQRALERFCLKPKEKLSDRTLREALGEASVSDRTVKRHRSKKKEAPGSGSKPSRSSDADNAQVASPPPKTSLRPQHQKAQRGQRSAPVQTTLFEDA